MGVDLFGRRGALASIGTHGATCWMYFTNDYQEVTENDATAAAWTT